jgi:hypothetical protein
MPRSGVIYALLLERTQTVNREDSCRYHNPSDVRRGNSGYDGRCDGTIHPSLREEAGMSATPMETQGALSAQLCCAKPRMVVEREIDSEDKR